VRSIGTVTLSARGPSDSWGRSPVDDQSRRGHQCSETTLTGESRFQISPPRGFEPVTLVVGSKQVSPLDQWDMVESCEIAGSPQGNVARQQTTLTGESRFHISPPRGFEPVTLVVGSKQVSPLDQWDMVESCEIAGSPQYTLFWEKKFPASDWPFFRFLDTNTLMLRKAPK
jgi:hypothetical protein